jgi:hypothetical protein
MDFDEIMASAGITTLLNDDVTATPPPNFYDDATVPQLPASLYGVELLFEDPIASDEDYWPPSSKSDIGGEFLKRFSVHSMLRS